MRKLYQLGIVAGLPLSTAFATASYLRKSRSVHAHGLVFKAEVSQIPALPRKLLPIARKLTGPALVRFSNTIWKKKQRRFDLLGCAIRFNWTEEDGSVVHPQHQDLLLATVPHVFSLPLAPFRTNSKSFFGNDYYVVAPFYIQEFGRVKYRLVSTTAPSSAFKNRDQELLELSERSQARFVLEMQSQQGAWKPIVDIQLHAKAQVDQPSLHFSPEHTGSGIYPAGFINGLRHFTYLASRKARPPYRTVCYSRR